MESNLNYQSIKSPEEVALLIKEMWLRHKAGAKQRENNAFMVELPQPTKEELAQAQNLDLFNYDQDELFGEFV